MNKPIKEKVFISLHGFHSSPQSLKALQIKEYLANHHPDIDFVCPQLPVFPKDMWKKIEAIFEQYKDYDIGVMGSSLGGFLATKAIQTYQVKAILVNPAITPDLLLTKYQGIQVHPYLQQHYNIDQEYIDQLITLNIERLNQPELAWVLLQAGDEVLDYREALNKYKSSKVTCEQGGNHSFIGFERYLKEIIHFLY